ncbi:MAG: SGNH/GDSL hydrolase family protein [Fibrobacteria bacterium]
MPRLRPSHLFLFLLSLTRMDPFADSTLVAVSDSNFLNGLSPLNWVRKSGFVASSICGASLKVGFTGTGKVAIQIDTKIIGTKVASRFPILAWSVNQGPLQTHQLKAGEFSIPLVSATANPVIDLYLKGLSPYENRYAGDSPENSVKITGLVLDAGGATRPIPLPDGIWMNIGNSIESGDAAAYASGQGRPPDEAWAASDDGRASYGYLLAEHYGFRESRLAYGGYNWASSLAGVPNLPTLVDNITSTASRLTGGMLVPRPDIVTINLGENGVPKSVDVTNALEKLRSRTGNLTKIIVMIPVSGKARAAVTDAFNAYKTGSQDANIFLVDLGKIAFATADGQHPTAEGHRSIYNAALPAFDKLIPRTTGIRARPFGVGKTPEVRAGFDAAGRISNPSRRISSPELPIR